MMTKKKKTVRRMMAYHEAGHAVVARLLDIDVPHVTMIPIDDHSAATAMISSAAWAARNGSQADHQKGHEIDMKISMGALHAQYRHQQRHKPYCINPAALQGDDDHNILNIAVHHLYLASGRELPAPGEMMDVGLSSEDLDYVNSLVARIWKETEILVFENWPAIERVAEALISCDLLDQSELDALIWNQAWRNVFIFLSPARPKTPKPEPLSHHRFWHGLTDAFRPCLSPVPDSPRNARLRDAVKHASARWPALALAGRPSLGFIISPAPDQIVGALQCLRPANPLAAV